MLVKRNVGFFQAVPYAHMSHVIISTLPNAASAAIGPKAHSRELAGFSILQ